MICLVALLLISPKLTAVMLTVVPLLVAGAVVYGRFVKKLSKAYQDALAASTQVSRPRLPITH